ncbi:hypothetical protein Acsp04_27210 [Actinomadura sp. NBRC 104425]|uniref:hypothetical protein n=1 Tax=Actinomadura sp. NBRC 104425 TaxID=3032204 RepID=UPI0024A5134C|nr:hypothetical protein [Actinomadura sp. NBRC 104425]GLZ12486.1 hypothetical protein Acsp04_27210 [Actinomadura sp. NBRC 104425]
MTKAPPKHARGRHAKPPSELAVRWDRMVKGLGESGRRKLRAAGAGTASLVLMGVAAAVVMSAAGGGDEAPRAAAAAEHGTGGRGTSSARTSGASASASASPTGSAAASAATSGDPDEVPEALTYLESKDPDKKITKHVEDVRRSGDFLRVYTDLEEGDENSDPAVSLCEWTTEFLKEGGDDEPRVFVHGKSEDNGSVVLANKQNDKDDCKVGETR